MDDVFGQAWDIDAETLMGNESQVERASRALGVEYTSILMEEDKFVKSLEQMNLKELEEKLKKLKFLETITKSSLFIPGMSSNMEMNLKYQSMIEKEINKRKQDKVLENDVVTNDWLKLYKNPTVSGLGRHVAKHKDANNYDWGMPEELYKNVPAKGMLTKTAREVIQEFGKTPIVKIIDNNLYIDAEGRYWVALGPNVMNPNYDGSHIINNDDMKFGTKLDIVVLDESTNTKYYIPAVVGDAKEHSAPDGLYQTGVPFDPNRITVEGDGSTIEFMGYDITEHSVNITNNYKLIEIIVYDGIYNYK